MGPGVSWTEVCCWKGALVIGFIAGFLERLVPDLLDKAAAAPMGVPSSQRPSGSRRQAPGKVRGHAVMGRTKCWSP